MKCRIALACLIVASACNVPGTQARVGDPAPAYGARTLEGDSLTLAGLHGKVVLLNVWATWCIPCRKEVPELQVLHEKFEHRGLKVIGVSLDDGSADHAVRAFIQEFTLTYTIVRDPGERITSAFFVPGVPATFLIDRSGKIAWRHLGPFTSGDPQLLNLLRRTLESAPPTS